MTKKLKVFVGDFQLNRDEMLAVFEVLQNGRISEGQKVKEFEMAFAKYIGTKHCIAVSSGTAALLVGLSALLLIDKFNVGKASKVITSPITYIATSNALVLSGFEPVYIDIDPNTFAILPEAVEEHLENVKDLESYSIILPVHVMGYPCQMDKINDIAKKYNLIVFEDAAQAHGTTYKGKKAGAMSILADFSFYIAHNIQAGEMGAITTDDKDVLKIIRKLKANGRLCDCRVCVRTEGKCPHISMDSKLDKDPRFTHDIIGYNFKTMEFQAALGLTQLKKVDWIFQQRLANVAFLNDNLKIFKDILQLPQFSKDVSYLAYPLVIKKPEIISRRELREALEKEGVETRPLFGSIPTQQPAYSYLKNKYKDKLPNANYIGENGFYIGCHQYLTKNDLEFAIETFKKILYKFI